MTQDRRDEGEAPAALPEAGARPEKVGEYLATQRRLRGISIDELCERTKIPRRNLERLESGAFDAKPDGFARGFVRTVALDLGLDADEAVMRLVGEPSPEDLSHGPLALAWLGRVAAVAVLVILGLLAWRALLWVGQPSASEPTESSGVTYRRDVVRGLADDAPPAAREPAETPAELEPAASATDTAVPTPPPD